MQGSDTVSHSQAQGQQGLPSLPSGHSRRPVENRYVTQNTAKSVQVNHESCSNQRQAHCPQLNWPLRREADGPANEEKNNKVEPEKENYDIRDVSRLQ